MSDIVQINERVVTPSTKHPPDIQYAMYFNPDRDSINSALFEECCKLLFRLTGNVSDSILIFSDHVLCHRPGNREKGLRA